MVVEIQGTINVMSSNHPETPSQFMEKVLHKTGSWCQADWGALYPTSLLPWKLEDPWPYWPRGSPGVRNSKLTSLPTSLLCFSFLPYHLKTWGQVTDSSCLLCISPLNLYWPIQRPLMGDDCLITKNMTSLNFPYAASLKYEPNFEEPGHKKVRELINFNILNTC